MKEKDYHHQSDYMGVCIWKEKTGQHIESSELYMNEFGHHKCPSGHDWGPDKKAFHTFHYIVKGKGIVMINDDYFALGPGESFYLAPEDIAYYRADNDDPWEYIWFKCSGTKSGIMFNSTILSKSRIITDTKDRFMERSIRKAESIARKKDVTSFEMTGFLYSFIGGLIRLFPRTRKVKDSLIESYIDAMTEFIEERYTESDVIGKLSNYFHLDRSYIYRLFKRYFNCSPLEYLENHRVDRACEMLADEKKTAYEAAIDVGFQSYTSFWRLFKKRTGLSPQEFREKDAVNDSVKSEEQNDKEIGSKT